MPIAQMRKLTPRIDQLMGRPQPGAWQHMKALFSQARSWSNLSAPSLTCKLETRSEGLSSRPADLGAPVQVSA